MGAGQLRTAARTHHQSPAEDIQAVVSSIWHAVEAVDDTERGLRLQRHSSNRLGFLSVRLGLTQAVLFGGVRPFRV